jgi:hypothetical protein
MTEAKNLQKSDIELPSELPVQLKVWKTSFDLHLKIPLPCRFCSDVYRLFKLLFVYKFKVKIIASVSSIPRHSLKTALCLFHCFEHMNV